jgi:hypothetical protein
MEQHKAPRRSIKKQGNDGHLGSVLHKGDGLQEDEDEK